MVTFGPRPNFQSAQLNVQGFVYRFLEFFLFSKQVSVNFTFVKGRRRMKRFFKPVEKEGSSKKPTLSADSPLKSNGEEVTNTTADENENKKKKEPSKFVTWNANSFLLRVKNNWPEFTSFIQNLDPDIIAIQVMFDFILLSLSAFQFLF